MIRAALTLLLAALTMPLLPGQSDAERREAVAEFRRYFPRFKTAAERVAAVQTLSGMDCPEAVAELMPLLQYPDQEVRNAALEVIGAYRQEASFAPMVEELAEVKDNQRKADMIRVLAAAEQKQVVPVLLEMVTASRRLDDTLAYELARAFGAVGEGEACREPLRTLLQHKGPLVRMAAADAAGSLRVKGLSEELVPLMSDGAWQVEDAAVQALGKIRDPAAVPPLIGALERGGRMMEAAADALFEITSLDFGTDAEMWQRQWDNLQSIDWRIPTDEELAKARAARARSDAFYGKRETNQFVGIKTTSTRVLFIIDVSGSMEDVVVERERFEQHDDLTKLGIVKSELLSAIDGLSKNTWFNIVAFATDLDPWKKRLVPANIVNRASASSWVKRLAPIGGSASVELAGAGLTGAANLEAGKTNTLKALMYPFSIDPEDPPKSAVTQGKVSIKNKLDTVFFLSDGRPSTGVLVDTLEILEEVFRVNEVFRIVFHAIAIGDFQKNFLRDLAEHTGGAFVDLGR